tara:strand:- start:125 stop:511 length:387 start_codon:yes stop_codon:yes gene_type:complete
LSSVNPNQPYRWVLLKHIGAPNDLRGIHFDLLLEDKEFCRTWRLSEIPLLNGPCVDSIYIAPHNLDWLDIEEKVLSGDRGFAKRVKKGIFLKSLPTIKKGLINLTLSWEDVDTDLVIDRKGCRIFTKK